MKPHHTTHELSRRDFLKQSLLGLAGLTLPWKSLTATALQAGIQGEQTIFGRVLKPELWIYATPSFSSTKIGRVGMNSILPILQNLQGQSDPYGNELWIQIAGSLYVHSSGVQIVENKPNPIVGQIPRRGKLGQVSVPIIQAWKDSYIKQKSFIPLYYGSNHWVTDLVQDDLGNSFYQIEEDQWGQTYFVKAECLHIFADEELKPIAPDIPAAKKHIEVLLKNQTIMAYENKQVVFQSPMSSGKINANKDYSTPPGDYEIIYKRPSRHMTHNDPFNDADSDLYGVPWVSYFTNTGIAFHGTYWHNEFNHPQSHGCINLSIENAKWVYLWSQPIVPPAERKFVSNHGTAVKVI